MKIIRNLVSIILLMTLASIQLVQAAHHHDESHHFAKHSQSSSQEDFQLTDTKCFICTFHSNQNTNAAILPAVFTLTHYTATPLVLEAGPDCQVKSNYARTSYNKGPPIPVTLFF